MIRMMNKLTRLFLLLTFAALLAAPLAASAAPDDTGSDSDAERVMGWDVTGPMGGDVRSLAIDPQDPQRLYFGTIDGQIYTSADGGATWERLGGFNRPGLYIDNLIVDPDNSKILYAAAHRHKEPGGFFKTTDGGATWRESGELKGEAIHALTQAAKEPDILVAGTTRGIFRSRDGGDTWEQMRTASTPGLVNVESLAVDPRDSNFIYAGTWYLPTRPPYAARRGASQAGIIDDSDNLRHGSTRQPDPSSSRLSVIYEPETPAPLAQGTHPPSRGARAPSQNPGAVATTPATRVLAPQNVGDDGRPTTARTRGQRHRRPPKNPQTIYIAQTTRRDCLARRRQDSPRRTRLLGRRATSSSPTARATALRHHINTPPRRLSLQRRRRRAWRPSTRNMPNSLISYAILQDQKT